MRSLAIPLTCILSSLFGSSPAVIADEPIGLSKQIDQLIRQLDDDSFSIREQSSGRLAGIGKPALDALQEAAKSPSAEVRYRARALIELTQRLKLYTVSRDGRLFRIDVGKNYMKISLVAKLGEPFEKPKVRVEGLTMTPTGILYASTVFDSDSGRQSRLYRIDSRTAAVTFIGKIAAAEVDGLDFGENGKLYGAISSCLRSQAAGLRQIVTIDTATGRASSTATEITFRDVDALAIAPTGMAFITSGSSGLYAVNLLRKNERSSVFTDLRFQRFFARMIKSRGCALRATVQSLDCVTRSVRFSCESIHSQDA
jgi:hypothetical protein